MGRGLGVLSHDTLGSPTTMATATETSLKSGFELLQTLSRLFHLVRFAIWQFFCWRWIPKDCMEVQERRKKVAFLRSHPPKNVKFGWFSRRSRAVTTNKCTKKRDARGKLLFCLCIPISFLPFSLTSPSPSSLLKLAIRDFKIQPRDGGKNVA